MYTSTSYGRCQELFSGRCGWRSVPHYRAQITSRGSLTVRAMGGFATLFASETGSKTARPSQPSNRVPPNGRLPPASPTGASGTLLPASLRSAIPTLPRLAPLVCVRLQPLHQVERWSWLVLGPRYRDGRPGKVVGPVGATVLRTECVHACEARPVQ